MRHVGRLRRPRQPSWADAWPTGNPTSRTAATSASVSRTTSGHAVAQWYKPMSNSTTAATQRALVDQHVVVAPMGHPEREAAGRQDQVHDRRDPPAADVGKGVLPDVAADVEVGRQLVAMLVVVAGSLARSLMHAGPHLLEALVGRRQRLGQHPCLGHRRHEVGVAVPSGQAVHVEVAGHAGAGGPAQVGADVEAVGS